EIRAEADKAGDYFRSFLVGSAAVHDSERLCLARRLSRRKLPDVAEHHADPQPARLTLEKQTRAQARTARTYIPLCFYSNLVLGRHFDESAPIAGDGGMAGADVTARSMSAQGVGARCMPMSRLTSRCSRCTISTASERVCGRKKSPEESRWNRSLL